MSEDNSNLRREVSEEEPPERLLLGPRGVRKLPEL